MNVCTWSTLNLKATVKYLKWKGFIEVKVEVFINSMPTACNMVLLFFPSSSFNLVRGKNNNETSKLISVQVTYFLLPDEYLLRIYRTSWEKNKQTNKKSPNSELTLSFTRELCRSVIKKLCHYRLKSNKLLSNAIMSPHLSRRFNYNKIWEMGLA